VVAVRIAKASARSSGGAGPAVRAAGRVADAVRAAAARVAVPAGGGGRGRTRNENVEKPRTDDNATSAEGREQPVIEPQVEETPKPVADAPDTTTPKQQVEDPTKLDESGGKG